jgi:hypothetical protein
MDPEAHSVWFGGVPAVFLGFWLLVFRRETGTPNCPSKENQPVSSDDVLAVRGQQPMEAGIDRVCIDLL